MYSVSLDYYPIRNKNWVQLSPPTLPERLACLEKERRKKKKNKEGKRKKEVIFFAMASSPPSTSGNPSDSQQSRPSSRPTPSRPVYPTYYPPPMMWPHPFFRPPPRPRTPYPPSPYPPFTPMSAEWSQEWFPAYSHQSQGKNVKKEVLLNGVSTLKVPFFRRPGLTNL